MLRDELLYRDPPTVLESCEDIAAMGLRVPLALKRASVYIKNEIPLPGERVDHPGSAARPEACKAAPPLP